MAKTVVFVLLFCSFIIYSAWVYTKGTQSPVVMNAMENRGKILFQEYNCTACHQVFGLGGYLGPDLTHTMSLPGKEALCRAMLQTGSLRMPAFRLNQQETEELVAYLKFVNTAAGIQNNK